MFGAEAAALEALRLEQAGVACTHTGVAETFERLTVEGERLGLDLKRLRARRMAA